MPHLLLKGVSSGIKFDGLNTTGNRYYVGFMNMELAGLHGSDKMLYVLEPNKLKFNTQMTCRDPAHVVLNSVPIANAASFVKGDVIRHIAYFEVGIRRSLPVVVEPLPEKEKYGRTLIERVTSKRTGEIMSTTVRKMIINPYSHNMKRSQYYDIYLNLVHEKHHVDTPEDVGEASSEYYAYKEVMNHLYFKYASPDYQDHVYEQFQIYEREVNRRR